MAQGKALTPEEKKAIVALKQYFDRTVGDLEEQEELSVQRVSNALGFGLSTVRKTMADYSRGVIKSQLYILAFVQAGVLILETILGRTFLIVGDLHSVKVLSGLKRRNVVVARQRYLRRKRVERAKGRFALKFIRRVLCSQ